MTVTPGSFITAAALLGSCASVLAVVFKLVRWMDRQKKQDAELQEIRDEQCVIVYGLLACLDGLKQLGANGNVTKARDSLDKHINKAAHRPPE